MTQLQTNLPEKSGEYKVIQASLDGVSYLWTGTSSHADCLTNLLETQGNRFGIYKTFERPLSRSEDRLATEEELTSIVTYETFVDPTSTLGFEIPNLEGTGYRVKGMGRVSIEAGQKFLHFFGESMSYGLHIDAWQIEFLLKRVKPDWHIIVSH